MYRIRFASLKKYFIFFVRYTTIAIAAKVEHVYVRHLSFALFVCCNKFFRSFQLSVIETNTCVTNR